MDEVIIREVYNELLKLTNDTVATAKEISATAKVIVIIEDQGDIQLCTSSEGITFSEITGLLSAMKFRHEIVESANFQTKMRAQEAINSGMKVFEMPTKGKAN